MKIYKVTIEMYRYWYSAYEHGWVKRNRYFTTKEKAIEFSNYYIENHLWEDFHNKLVPMTDESYYPSSHIEEIEVDDFSLLI